MMSVIAMTNVDIISRPMMCFSITPYHLLATADNLRCYEMMLFFRPNGFFITNLFFVVGCEHGRLGE